MKSPTFIEANPYLRDPGKRRRAILRSVATSSAIEGIRAPFRKPAAKSKVSKLARPVSSGGS